MLAGIAGGLQGLQLGLNVAGSYADSQAASQIQAAGGVGTQTTNVSTPVDTGGLYNP